MNLQGIPGLPALMVLAWLISENRRRQQDSLRKGPFILFLQVL
jgi:hypothetical protein